MRVMDQEEGVLVPFSYFYDTLHKFIDHQHSQVISDAEDNSKLDAFDVELLKVLFMIKYVKEIKANVDNLTTLMISSIYDERVEVRKKVEQSLKRLIGETLVQKNGEIYIFLTNEEQEINNAINSETVELGEIIGEVSMVIFEEIYKEKKFRYSNRYMFPFNQKVDDRFYKGNQSNGIGLTIITPYGSEYTDAALRLLSASDQSVIMKLPNDTTFLDEIRGSIQIYKYLNKNASGAQDSFESIRRAKEDERLEKKDRIRIYIEEALKNADIYVNGDKAVINAKEASSRIDEAMRKLVETQYNKLTYMETAPELSDIAHVLRDDGGQITLGVEDTTPNKLALEEVLNVIDLNNQRHIKTSLKALSDKFAAVPYGFDPKDVQWLVAMLFKQGRISMILNSQTLSLLSNSHEELVKYITKREYVEKLLIDIRVRATDRQIRSVKEVIKDYFGGSVSSEDDDVLMKAFKNFAKNKKQFFDDIMVEYRINPDLPSKSLMEKAKKNLEVVMNIKDSVEFFKTVDEMRDDLLDDAEDTTPVFDFFKGEQKKIFEKTQKYLSIFDKSKTYVRDQKVLDVVAKMTEIVKGRNPYSQIQNLPDLNQQFMDVYAKLLEEEAEEMRPIVEADFKIVRDVLADKTFADQFTSKVNRSFEELLEKLKSSNEIAAVKNIKLESDTLKLRLLDEIEDYERSHQPIEPSGEEHPGEASGAEGGTGETPMSKPPATPKKKRKNVSISSVAGARTYSLENEQDIDRFLAEMKAKLMEELGDDTIITLS